MIKAKVEKEVAVAYHTGDSEKIKSILDELIVTQRKLDRWFDKYLDMFDDRMNTSEQSDPVWKLYRKKFDLYCDVKQTIETTKYFLGKA